MMCILKLVSQLQILTSNEKSIHNSLSATCGMKPQGDAPCNIPTKCRETADIKLVYENCIGLLLDGGKKTI